MNSIGNNIFFVEVGHLNRNWPYANICEKTRKSYFQLYQQVIHQRIVHFTVRDLQYVYQFNMNSIGNNIFFVEVGHLNRNWPYANICEKTRKSYFQLYQQVIHQRIVHFTVRDLQCVYQFNMNSIGNNIFFVEVGHLNRNWPYANICEKTRKSYFQLYQQVIHQRIVHFTVRVLQYVYQFNMNSIGNNIFFVEVGHLNRNWPYANICEKTRKSYFQLYQQVIHQRIVHFTVRDLQYVYQFNMNSIGNNIFFVEVGHLNRNWPYANICEKTRKSYFQLYQQVIHQRIVHFTVRVLQCVYQFNMNSIGNNIFFVEVGHLNRNWPYANICEKTRKSYFQLYQQVIHQRIVHFTVRVLQYVYQFNMNSIGNNIFFVEVGHLNRNWPYANICEKTRKSYFQLYQQVIHQRIVHFTVRDLQYVYQFNMNSIGNNIFFVEVGHLNRNWPYANICEKTRKSYFQLYQQVIHQRIVHFTVRVLQCVYQFNMNSIGNNIFFVEVGHLNRNWPYANICEKTRKSYFQLYQQVIHQRIVHFTVRDLQYVYQFNMNSIGNNIFFVEVGHLNRNWPYANICEKTRKSYFQLYQQVIHQRIVHFTVRVLQYVYQFNMNSIGNNIFLLR